MRCQFFHYYEEIRDGWISEDRFETTDTLMSQIIRIGQIRLMAHSNVKNTEVVQNSHWFL